MSALAIGLSVGLTVYVAVGALIAVPVYYTRETSPTPVSDCSWACTVAAAVVFWPVYLLIAGGMYLFGVL